MDLLWFTFLILTGVRLISGACGGCSSRNVQCLTSTTYKLCNRGTPVGITYACSPNQICVSEDPAICIAAGVPDCTCGTCTGGFACISPTQFKLCMGDKIGDGATAPNTDVITCPANTYCDITSMAPSYCTNTMGTSGCLASDTCSMIGRMPLSGTSCKRYAICEISDSGNWLRTEFTCPGSSLFNPNTRKCTANYTCI